MIRTKKEQIEESKYIVFTLEQKVKASIFQLRMLKDSITSHNFIVKVGAYTVSRNPDNTLVLVQSLTPSQWNEAGVKEILSVPFYSTFKGDRIEVKPEVINVKEYYENEIKKLRPTLSMLYKNLNPKT